MLERRGHALEHEHPAPAVRVHEVARDDRHPQHRDRRRQRDERVGERALALGEPVVEEDQQRGEDRGLDEARQRAYRAEGRKLYLSATISAGGEVTVEVRTDEPDRRYADGAVLGVEAPRGSAFPPRQERRPR